MTFIFTQIKEKESKLDGTTTKTTKKSKILKMKMEKSSLETV